MYSELGAPGGGGGGGRYAVRGVTKAAKRAPDIAGWASNAAMLAAIVGGVLVLGAVLGTTAYYGISGYLLANSFEIPDVLISNSTIEGVGGGADPVFSGNTNPQQLRTFDSPGGNIDIVEDGMLIHFDAPGIDALDARVDDLENATSVLFNYTSVLFNTTTAQGDDIDMLQIDVLNLYNTTGNFSLDLSAIELAIAQLQGNLSALDMFVSANLPTTLTSTAGQFSLVVNGTSPNLVIRGLTFDPITLPAMILPDGSIYVSSNGSGLNITGIAALMNQGLGEPIVIAGFTGPTAFLASLISTDGSLLLTSVNGTIDFSAPNLAVAYVDNLLGNDTACQGTPACPFLTLARAQQNQREGQPLTAIIVDNNRAPYPLAGDSIVVSGSNRGPITIVCLSQISTNAATPYASWSHAVGTLVRTAVVSETAPRNYIGSVGVATSSAYVSTTLPAETYGVAAGSTNAVLAAFNPANNISYNLGTSTTATLNYMAPNALVVVTTLNANYPVWFVGVEVQATGAFTFNSDGGLYAYQSRILVNTTSVALVESVMQLSSSIMVSYTSSFTVPGSRVSLLDKSMFVGVTSPMTSVYGTDFTITDSAMVRIGGAASWVALNYNQGGSLTAARSLFFGGINAEGTNIVAANNVFVVSFPAQFGSTSMATRAVISARGFMSLRLNSYQMIQDADTLVPDTLILSRGSMLFDGGSVFYSRTAAAATVTGLVYCLRGTCSFTESEVILTTAGTARVDAPLRFTCDATINSRVCSENTAGTLTSTTSAIIANRLLLNNPSVINGTCTASTLGVGTSLITAVNGGVAVSGITAYTITDAQVIAAPSAQIYYWPLFDTATVGMVPRTDGAVTPALLGSNQVWKNIIGTNGISATDATSSITFGLAAPTTYDMVANTTLTGFTNAGNSHAYYQLLTYGVDGYSHQLRFDGMMTLTTPTTGFGKIVLTLPGTYYWPIAGTNYPPLNGDAFITVNNATDIREKVVASVTSVCSNTQVVLLFESNVFSVAYPATLTISFTLPLNTAVGTVFDTCAATTITGALYAAWNQRTLMPVASTATSPRSQQLITDDSLVTIVGSAGAPFEIQARRGQEWGTTGAATTPSFAVSVPTSLLYITRPDPDDATFTYNLQGYLIFQLTMTSGTALDISWARPLGFSAGPAGPTANYPAGGSCTLTKTATPFTTIISPIRQFFSGNQRQFATFNTGSALGALTILCTPIFDSA